MNKQELRSALECLGVKPGDLLMVHASLRRIGLGRADVGEGGAERLLDALDDAVGPGGSLMMVLGTHYEMEWVYEHPPGERAGLLEGAPAFDHRNAPVLPEVGWLAEAFRRRPGTLVSDNPSGRFGARGRFAEALMAGQPWDDYYGPGSPLQKLCERGGKVLRMGANPETVTALHYAEYLADLPDKKRVRWDYVLAGSDGAPVHRWIDCLDDLNGIVHVEGEDYFARILKAYLALGRHREAMVGRAKAELLGAADIVAFGARWMEENLAAPAQADPDCAGGGPLDQARA
jgi:aminoglycoside N3'-acetyltransferase